MKKSLPLLIILSLFFSACASVSKFFAKTPPPPPPTYISPRTYSEKINLNQIKVESINELPTEPLAVYKGADGNNYLFLNLAYENSGLSIIEAIKSGEILDNSIIVRDQTGKIIGTDAINFQAFATIEKKVYKNVKEIVRTGDGFATPVRPESNKREIEPTVIETTINKIYTDKEKVPQVIKLTELPPNNSYVSINVELVYIDPFLQQICKENNNNTESKEKVPCTYVEESVKKEVRDANKRKLDAIIADYKTPAIKPSEKKSPKKFILSASEIQTFKDKMKRTVSKTGTTLENDKTKVASSVVDIDKAKLNYREWSLVSTPKYFQINTETIRPLIGEAPIPEVKSTPAKTSSPPESVVTEPISEEANTVSPSKTLPVEGFSDTVTLKNGTVFKNVKTSIKEDSVVITTQDGKTIEVKKSELIGIKK